MAKQRAQKNKNGKKNTRRVRSRPVPRGVGRSLTPAESKYMELLRNPCTGPLVRAPGSSEGGSIIRFETDFITGNGATSTAGFLNWAPGAYNNFTPNAYGPGGVVASAVNDTTAVSVANLVPAEMPGYTFLQNNASSYRCIAACMQIYWPGSELNRSGIVSAAQGTYGLLSIGTNVATQQVRSLSPHVERMPTDMIEAIWAPSYSDGLFRANNPVTTTGTIPEDGHSSLLCSWAGIPVSTGVRIRLVGVFEWRPKILGLVLSSNTADSGGGSVQFVRTVLDHIDPNWWYHARQAAARFVANGFVQYASTRGRGMPRAMIRNEL
jgi:hypothetical protein